MKKQFQDEVRKDGTLEDRIEKYLLLDEGEFKDKSQNDLAQRIKSAGMELSRAKAADFNQFITAALGE